MSLRFCTMFPRCENVHLIKDVGMIPYILHKEYGYDSRIVGYDHSADTMPFLDTAVKGLRYEQMPRKKGLIADGVAYLLKNGRKIDVLQLYHITSRENLRWILTYKLVNPKGKVYVKLDADWDIFENFRFREKGVKGILRRLAVKQCDLISAETRSLCLALEKDWGVPVAYIPNGFYDGGSRKAVKPEEKEQVICTVGRLGTQQKNTQELLSAFAAVSQKHPTWQLRLIGPMETGFDRDVELFYQQNPHLRQRVVFTGNINDRQALDQEYRRAKIFCLTSRWESFGLVLVEALKSGCYIISSEVNGVKERTDNGRLGTIYPIEDTQSLIQALDRCLESLPDTCQAAQDFAYTQYYWPKICDKIQKFLNE